MSFQSISRRESDGYTEASRNNNSYGRPRQTATRRYSSIDEYSTTSRQNSNRSSGVGELSKGNLDEESTSPDGGRSAQFYRGNSAGHRGNAEENSEGFSGNDATNLGSSELRSSVGGSDMTGQGYGSQNSSGGQSGSFGICSEDAYSNGSSGAGQTGHVGGHSSDVSVSGTSRRFVIRGQRGGYGDSHTTASSGSISGGNSIGGLRGGSFSSRSLGGFSGGGLSGAHVGDYGSHSSTRFGGFSCAVGEGDYLLQSAEKEIMQNLNNRLAFYVENVSVLEKANSKLNENIKHWQETNKAEKTDNSRYYAIMEDYREKIIAAHVENNRISLRTDNARIAADDFKQKYETELCLRQNMECDLNRLRKMQDDLTLTCSSLEAETESLREKRTFMKKNHEEDLQELQNTTFEVNVQLEAAPGISVHDILKDLRMEYEDVIEQHQQKAEADFNLKISELNKDMSSHSGQIQTNKNEVTELRHAMQTFEIDLQSQLAKKNSIENTLAETKARYCSQLANIQDMIGNLEEQLNQCRNDMERQSVEYELLLNTKTRLGNEIVMYRRLLEAEGPIDDAFHDDTRRFSPERDGNKYNESSSVREADSPAVSTPDEKKNRLVTTIIEERMNGKLISTKVDTIEQKM